MSASNHLDFLKVVAKERCSPIEVFKSPNSRVPCVASVPVTSQCVYFYLLFSGIFYFFARLKGTVCSSGAFSKRDSSILGINNQYDAVAPVLITNVGASNALARVAAEVTLSVPPNCSPLTG